MAVAKCNISFKVDYTSSASITSATVSYKIISSADPFTVFSVDPSLIMSNSLIALPDIPVSGEYVLVVELQASDGGVARYETSFQIGKCDDSSCKTPFIHSIEIAENGQIVMNYEVDTDNLTTPEYQIATDADFKNIIHLKVDFGYNPVENINMNDGNVPNDTTLYIRARKHCSPSGVSEWSKVVMFRSGMWVVVRAPYAFGDAYAVSGRFKDPTNWEELGTSICQVGGVLMKTINLTTSFPQAGSYIYLSDGVTPATPANLITFDTSGASMGFRETGIKWIRFESYNGSRIYDVDSSTGLITGISASFDCTS